MRRLSRLVPVIIFGLAGCNMTTQQNWASINGASIQNTESTQKRCEAKANIAYLKALSGVQEKESDIDINVENSIIIAKQTEPNPFQRGQQFSQESHRKELKLRQQQKVQQALENISNYAMTSCMEEAGYRLHVN